MQCVVITNCTGRKRSLGVPASIAQCRESSVARLALSWLDVLQTGHPKCPVGRLYAGRSVTEASFVSTQLSAQLLFVSTGLGLVDEHEVSPTYDLTVAAGPSSILPSLERLGATTSDWWLELNVARNRPTPIRELLERSTVDLVLLALPAGYLDLISGDIQLAGLKARAKLRVFTSDAGSVALPGSLRQYVLPYDDRLEAVYAGTRTDFPQRAMRHFVEKLDGRTLSLDASKQAVAETMSSLVPRSLPVRARASDEEIVRLMMSKWADTEGRSTQLLRFLRDDALVACEQRRFRDLWRLTRSMLESEVAHG